MVAAPRADASFNDMNAAVSRLQQIAAEVPNVKLIPNPQQPPPQPDRPYVITLQLDFNNTGAVDVAKQLRKKVGIVGDQAGQIADGRVKLYVIGQGALGAAAQTSTKHDIARAEQWNLPIVLIVLLAVFGSLAAAAMPLALGICTVVVTMGLVYLLSIYMTMSVFVSTTVSMFGIALAIDYSLFILMRFREELRLGRDPKDAADAAMGTSGLAVVLSGLTVIASVTGIYLIHTPVLDSMATGAILAVAVAVLTSSTLTPAVLGTFGRAMAKRSVLLHWSRQPDGGRSKFWTRWTGWVMHRPWLSALAAAGFLLTLAAPTYAMVLGNSMQRQFPATHEIRGGVAAAAEALGPGALGPVRVLVTFPVGNSGGATAPTNAHLLDDLRQQMQQAPNIVSVSPPVASNDKNSALLSAVLSVDPEDMAARETVTWMREHLPGTAAKQARVDVGGPTALVKDFDDRVSSTQPWVFLFVSLIAFLMLLVSVRSIVLAAKGVLMTVLSVAAAYGSLVAVFQWGWLAKLGLAPLTSIDSTIPPLVLAMTFGLSMDYEIFLLTRIRERFRLTNNTRDAVGYGVSTSARTITSAALIMIAVFIGFAFAGMPLVAELGVACAVAIAVDATVVRLVLVPALMAMFDEWNWWLPAWLARRLPSVDFEQPIPKVDVDDLVVIPDHMAMAAASSSDLRMVAKSALKLKTLVPYTISVSDPHALSGCETDHEPLTEYIKCDAEPVLASSHVNGNGHHNGTDTSHNGTNTGHNGTNGTNGHQPPGATATEVTVKIPIVSEDTIKIPQFVHPVTMWRGRLSVALDALETAADNDQPEVRRRSPMETTNVQLPTGDRWQIPTGAETLRLKGYLIMCRNSARDYTELADLVKSMGTRAAAEVLSEIDRYYSDRYSRQNWVATQLVRRLADPKPSDDPEARTPSADEAADWNDVRQRCLSVAIAMLEEVR
jgi:RND superfamily putative drug exporter